MAIFAISDLHLALGADKPMDVFGGNWANYMTRIEQNWSDTVSTEDTVIVGGDISWATYLSDCYADFQLIDRLPGQKIFLKGNHDYWWESLTKMRRYVQQQGFATIDFLHNNSYFYKGVAICGSRGWNDPSYDGYTAEDEKIYEREMIRLCLSLDDAKQYGAKKTVVALHYPPVTKNRQVNGRYRELFAKYKVQTCVYGHLHSGGAKNAFEGMDNGVLYRLVSADFMGFLPMKLEI